MEVRGWIGSLLPCRYWGLKWVCRVGGKHFIPLYHPTSLGLYFLMCIVNHWTFRNSLHWFPCLFRCKSLQKNQFFGIGSFGKHWAIYLSSAFRPQCPLTHSFVQKMLIIPLVHVSHSSRDNKKERSFSSHEACVLALDVTYAKYVYP